ncbi:hypothetical protein [Sorangium sp. So ce1389]
MRSPSPHLTARQGEPLISLDLAAAQVERQQVLLAHADGVAVFLALVDPG